MVWIPDYNWVKAAVLFFLGSVLLATAVSGYTINGSCVYHETDYYKIEQCPAVLNDLSNYVNLSVTNKDANPHNIMLAYGFDTSVAQPKKAWKWGMAQHYVPTYGWVSTTYTCDGNFNYSLSPKYFWCFDYNETLKFEHSFVNGWPANKTAEWFEWGQNGWEIQWWNDWIDVSSVFTTQEFQGKTWYYAPQNISFAAHETKVLRALISVKPNSVGKYDLFAWRGEWTALEAWGDASKSLLLDPWYNASWDYRKGVNVTDGWNLNRSSEPVNINFTGLQGFDNCSYNRLTWVNGSGDENDLDFMILDNGAAGAAASKYCYIQFTGNLSTDNGNATHALLNSTNYYFYYGNNTDVSDGNSPDLRHWETQYNAWSDPVSDGWPTDTVNGVVQNYTYLSPLFGDINSVLQVNNTNGANYVTWQYGATLATTRTVAFRGNFISNSTNEFSLSAYFVDNPITARRGSNILNGWILAGHPDNEAAETWGSATATTTGWHDYRAVYGSQSDDFSIFIDGVNTTFGTNAAMTVNNGAGGHLSFGTTIPISNDQGIWELDYITFTANGYFPPLSYALGAEEDNGVTGNYSVNCYDESTGNDLTNCGISVSNSTDSNSSVGNYFGNASSPSGNLTVVGNRTGFYDRTYYFTWSNTSVVQNDSIYLINASLPTIIFVRFHVQNIAGAAISNAFVNVTTSVGGSVVSVGQAYTDGFGLASFYLDASKTYYVEVSHASYDSELLAVTPVLNDYTIILGGTTYASPESCYSGLSIYRYPRINSLLLGSTYINWTITSHDSSLSYFGWNLSRNDTSINFTNITTLAGGGTTYYLIYFNETNATGNVSFVAWWSFANQSECFDYGFFNVYNVTGTSGLAETLANIREDTELGDVAFSFIALFITMLAVAYFSRYTAAGGALVGALVAAVFTFTGWLNPLFFAFLCVAGLAWGYFVFSRGY